MESFHRDGLADLIDGMTHNLGRAITLIVDAAGAGGGSRYTPMISLEDRETALAQAATYLERERDLIQRAIFERDRNVSAAQVARVTGMPVQLLGAEDLDQAVAGMVQDRRGDYHEDGATD